jgi:hypothetical protein
VTEPNPKPPGETPASGKAEHGGRTELTWNEGEGRQPYANQGDEEAGPAGGGDEFTAGDRGDLSGRTKEQLEQVKKLP